MGAVPVAKVRIVHSSFSGLRNTRSAGRRWSRGFARVGRHSAL